MKSLGVTMRVLIAVSTAESAIKRAERLHQIQRQRRPAEPRLMVEPDERIEADGVADDRQVLGQQAVGEREQRVDRIARRPAVAVRRSRRSARPSLPSSSALIMPAKCSK